jgi:hypothetical protein
MRPEGEKNNSLVVLRLRDSQGVSEELKISLKLSRSSRRNILSRHTIFAAVADPR